MPCLPHSLYSWKPAIDPLRGQTFFILPLPFFTFPQEIYIFCSFNLPATLSNERERILHLQNAECSILYFVETETDDCGQLCCVIPLANAQLAQHSVGFYSSFFGAKIRKEKDLLWRLATACHWAPFTRVEPAISSGWTGKRLHSTKNFFKLHDEIGFRKLGSLDEIACILLC